MWYQRTLKNSRFAILVSVIIIVGVLTRFWLAHEKPFHHDESLHAFYSLKVAQGQPHVYDGMLHGPALYYIVGAIFYLFGATDLTAHLGPSLFGVLLIASPLLLRRYLGNFYVLILMISLVISPTLMYFSRFLREDVFTSVWIIGSLFGAFIFYRTQKSWAALFASAMLAMHFINKENSYLHCFIWGLAILTIWFSLPRSDDHLTRQKIHWPLIFGCIAVFSGLFILFFSAFFRHPQGVWQGVWDGIYGKSLAYWWDQNQKRRIDGPFDYHLPILANYEFVFVPFLAMAWFRILQIAKASFQWASNRRVFIFLGLSFFLLLTTAFAPRIALVSEACSYSEYCPLWSADVSAFGHRLAKLLHIAHTRHLLQIVSYIWFGGSAFFLLVRLNQRAEAFLIFWLTASCGIYSYVGEKVPWLTTYIVLPLVLVSSIEVTRIFKNSRFSLEETDLPSHQVLFKKIVWFKSLLWLLLAIPFTLFKGVRVSFWDAANPAERLIFTQTTPTFASIDRRIQKAQEASHADIRITMFGDPTWPMAWYAQKYKTVNYIKPSSEQSLNYDAIFLDVGDITTIEKQYPEFAVYEVPLRHWWVPQPNPSYREILNYFFRRKIYGGNAENPSSQGFGETKVFYLERIGPGTVFSPLPFAPFLRPQSDFH